ncbi:glycoside hydrolase family 88 protein [Terrimonas sp. NA20]|uniref:Glycoside hydrolase family 88 protein n=1 Tax=Terrimonas ginsenosidimutans TaxID=2908004 RepID=A0ABS9KU44_9BACT|nr:glycoside hydrolase family 88 protein [Terrimonas ginsenosidimutans]MCG2615869.1 glycoside hydrolase family 88 protein [Terrimonas ginsenosidimutans]
MRLPHHTRRLFFFLSFLSFSVTALGQQRDALSLSRRIADKVITDTRFEWKWVAQKDELGMQVLDLRFLSLAPNSNALALRSVEVKADTTVRFGLSGSGRIKVWVNRQLCFDKHQAQTANPKEIAYNRFTFDHYFSVPFKKGQNEMLIEYTRGSSAPVLFLRAVTAAGDQELSVNFTTSSSAPWMYAGPVRATDAAPFPLMPYYENGSRFVNWQSAPQRMLPELVTDSSAAYQRDPYSDWQYSHGSMVWSILALKQETGSDQYLSFAKKYSSFILDHLNYLQWQYDSLNAWRGSYHRIFRKSMLDDAGAPALSFAGLYLLEKDSVTGRFLEPFTDYIYHGQVRLSDSTFCRPEPEEFTVWADDLFMSVPYLLRIAKVTNDKRYTEDAVRQALQFRKYLLNAQTGLYKHGWFSKTNQPSVAYWGRANGWVAWATAELLEWLPPDHPSYKKVLDAFRQHMTSLVKYQSDDGFWHQLLTRPDSYRETSCTAMFALAMARGVRKGWLNKSFKKNALKAWEAVASKIDDSGVVHGICRGTEIGMDEQFYLDRKTIDNDPRGLGAVITAGIEIAKLP